MPTPAYPKPFTTRPVTGLKYSRRYLAIGSEDYYTDQFKKEAYYLHFTASLTAASAINWWKQDKVAVGTCDVLDTDGIVHEVFPASCWAFHLGLSGSNYRPDHLYHTRSAGVEIVNPGPLRLGPDPNYLYWYPKNFTTVYCRRDEVDKYIELPRPWRGEKYFATYTPAQLTVLPLLVKWRMEELSIPMFKLAPSHRLNCSPSSALYYRGLLGHQNVRMDKLDPGPALDWDGLFPFLSNWAANTV